MSRPAPASWPIPIPSPSSRNASIRRKPCSAPRRKPSDLRARRGGGSSMTNTPDHEGELEGVIYVLRGRARMRWGERLEFTAEAGPGDFIYVPPFVPHQEINASASEPLECVVVRSDNEAVVINLDIEPVEKPDEVLWIDPIHKG